MDSFLKTLLESSLTHIKASPAIIAANFKQYFSCSDLILNSHVENDLRISEKWLHLSGRLI